MAAKRKKPVEPTWPQVHEAFSDPTFNLSNWKRHREPSCWNGAVTIRRWRVTVEMVDESPDVLKARLLKLWRETDNHHHWTPLKAAAAKLGYELPHAEMGVDRKKAGAP